MKRNVGVYMIVCFLELLVSFGIAVVATISIMNNWPVVFKIILSVLFGMEFVCILTYEWIIIRDRTDKKDKKEDQ